MTKTSCELLSRTLVSGLVSIVLGLCTLPCRYDF